MILDAIRLTVQHIAKSIGISSSWANTVLTEILVMSKLTERYVLRMLTPEHKLKTLTVAG